MLTKKEAIHRLNELGDTNRPFSFYCDFLGDRWCIEETSRAKNSKSFQIKLNDESDHKSQEENSFHKAELEKHPISIDLFKSAFDQVVNEINIGNSFLTNLTFEIFGNDFFSDSVTVSVSKG